MKPIKPIYVVIVIIVFAAAGFYGGVTYQKQQLRAGFANSAEGGQFAGRFNGGGGMMGRFQGTGPVRGQIVSHGDNSITVKSVDGSSKIVNLTGQTRVNRVASGSQADLKSGITVTVIGSVNSDGSLTAQDITIGNEMFRFRAQSSQ